MKSTRPKLSKGFSLIEMLVVIAVIGVIFAFAAPNIGRDSREETERRAAVAEEAARQKEKDDASEALRVSLSKQKEAARVAALQQVTPVKKAEAVPAAQ